MVHWYVDHAFPAVFLVNGLLDTSTFPDATADTLEAVTQAVASPTTPTFGVFLVMLFTSTEVYAVLVTTCPALTDCVFALASDVGVFEGLLLARSEQHFSWIVWTTPRHVTDPRCGRSHVRTIETNDRLYFLLF